MKTETREERIKRMIEERNSGKTSVVPTVAPPVDEPAIEEDEARLISRENEQRIKDASKKSAEIATQGAQVASKLAKEGWSKGLRALEDLKSKAAARAEEKRVAQLQKGAEAEEQQRSVDAPDSVSEEQHEAPSASKPVRPTWLTPRVAAVTVGLVILGVGAAWFVRQQRNEEPTFQATVAPVKAIEPPQVEAVQVMPVVEAAMPEPAPPTELPPPPPATPTLTETVVAPVAPKPTQHPQVASTPKVPTKKSQSKPVKTEKEWQQDASKKLDEWGF